MRKLLFIFACALACYGQVCQSPACIRVGNGNPDAIPASGLVVGYGMAGWSAGTQSIPNIALGGGIALQLGSASGADTNDPTPAATGLSFSGVDDYDMVLNFGAVSPTSSGSALFVANLISGGPIPTFLGFNAVNSSNRWQSFIIVGSPSTMYNDFGDDIAGSGRLSSVYPGAYTGWQSVATVASTSGRQNFLNGALIGVGSGNAAITPVSTWPAYIGSATASAGYIKGTMAVACVWNRRLSPLEVWESGGAARRMLAPLGVALP